jgi:hypothetical protein
MVWYGQSARLAYVRRGTMISYGVWFLLVIRVYRFCLFAIVRNTEND